MDIAQFGCFDIRSYGDLLHPLVARYRLRGHSVAAVAPLGGALLPWLDAGTAARADRLLEPGLALDACLIGGGDIIHTGDGAGAAYHQDGLTVRFAMPSLWLGAGLIAAQAGARLIWNAPCVPEPVTHPATRALVAALLNASDYVSVGDADSRARLADCVDGATEIASTISVVPDAAVDIATIWPRDSLMARFEALAARRGLTPAAPPVLFHLSGTVGNEATGLAELVTRVATSRGRLPILLSGTAEGDDGGAARAVASLLTIPHLLVDRPGSLHDIAACLAVCELYVGTCKSAFMTAFAYGNTGLLIGDVPPSWLTDLVPNSLADAIMCKGWDRVVDALDNPIISDGEPWRTALVNARLKLDVHWQRIGECLDASASTRGAQRASFARAVAADNERSSGWIGQLRGVMGRVAEQRRPPPLIDLLERPFLIIQGRPAHISRQGRQLVIHPPPQGRTEVGFDPIPLRGGDVLCGTVTLAHGEANPVRFEFLLAGRDGTPLAAVEVVVAARRSLPWRLRVPDGFDGIGLLLVATSMQKPEDSSRFAWAMLVDVALDSAGFQSHTSIKGNNSLI